MKTTLVMLMVFTSSMFANDAASQVAKVNLKVKNAKLITVLEAIEKQTEYLFVYDKNEVNLNYTVTLNAENISVAEVLTDVFRSTNVIYAMEGSNIMLMRGSSPALQQDGKTVTGTVVDTNGEPIPGASIVVKGTTTGTITDMDGNFTLSGVPEDATLAFSFVGMRMQEISVGNRTRLNVVMEEVSIGLDEVVAIGYSSQSKRDLTSAVVSLDSKEINKRVATNPTQLLQGKLPGLQIVQNSGEPGNENFQLQIRGKGTFSGAGSNPLIIVDGLPGSLSGINPNDVESVTVLKDAASAAIYGSRGANGVIVITTKSGDGQGLTLELNSNVGITSANSLPDFITNSAEYMELHNEALMNVGAPPVYKQEDIELYRNATDRDMYPNYDWTDEMFRTVAVSNHYLSASGGKEGTNFNVSLGFNDQPGVFHGFEYKKYTSQINLNSQVTDRINFGVNTLLQYGSKWGPQSASDQFLSTLAAIPMAPPRLPDGRFVGSVLNGRYRLGNKNPVAMYNTTRSHHEGFYIQSNLFLDVEILEGLHWETRGGVNYGQNKANEFRPTIPLYDYTSGDFAYNLEVGSKGLSVQNVTGRHTTIYSQLRYQREFDLHTVNLIGGLQQETDKYEDLRGSRRGFPTNALRELSAGPSEGQTNYGSAAEWALRSYYGTANYSFNDTYLIGTSLRYDGTSRLPKDTRWGLFYSFSGGVRLSELELFNDISWLNDLKIRTSWGELGNQNIGNYPYQSVLSQTQYNFGGNTVIGFRPGGLVDQSLTWETTRVVDVGFDAAMLDYALTVTLDYYVKTTFDILRGSQVPEYTGLAAPTVNNGKMENKGFELVLNYQSNIGKNWSYNIGGNLDAFKNKLIDFGVDELGGITINSEGLEYNQYYMYEYDGIFQTEQEVEGWADQTGVGPQPAPGDLKLKDQDNNGVINQDDRILLKGQYPSLNYSLNLGLGWKNFDFTTFFFGSQGRKIYVTGWGIEPFRQGSIPTTDWRDRWTPENKSTTMPRIYTPDRSNAISGYASTYFLKDASFFRIKNITLGYSLPDEIFENAGIGLSSVRFYFTGDNILTFTKYPGLDPERIGGGTYVTYPQVRTLTFGLNIKF